MRRLLLVFFFLPVYSYAQDLEDLAELPKPKPIYQKSKGWCSKEGSTGSDTELNPRTGSARQGAIIR